ncbi:TPA: hypothetical protein ACKMSS_001884, partial [Neisseria gonorrhoeae]
MLAVQNNLIERADHLRAVVKSMRLAVRRHLLEHIAQSADLRADTDFQAVKLPSCIVSSMPTSAGLGSLTPVCFFDSFSASSSTFLFLSAITLSFAS